MAKNRRFRKPVTKSAARWNREVALIVCCLVSLTLAVYARTISFDFVNYDDDRYAYETPQVLGGLTTSNLHWAFSTYTMGHWHPLTWISLMTDAQIAKGLQGSHHSWLDRRAGVFHATNVALHTLNVLLLFLLLASITGMRWRSALVAALFAVHPLHVESVAWVSERKDVLSTFFWLGTMGVYVWCVRRPGWIRYGLVVLAFVLGLMAKSMLMTLPVALLLLDFWPLGRSGVRPLRRQCGGQGTGNRGEEGKGRFLSLVLEKAPLFVVAVPASLLALRAERLGGTVVTFDALPFAQRWPNAVVSYGAYVLKMLWPSDLAVLYPLRRAIPAWEVVLAAAFVVAMTVLAIRAAKRDGKWLTFGWFWYVITLLPVAGFVQIGAEALADHRMCVPLIGLYVIVAWGVPAMVERVAGPRPMALGVAAVAVIAALAVVGHNQVGYWKNGVALWERTLSVTDANPIAELNCASALADEGRYEESVPHYNAAIELRPRYPEACIGLGTVLAQMNRFREAEPYLRRAVELVPANVQARGNLGAVLLAQGRAREAIEQLDKTVEMDPNNERARMNLETARGMVGDRGER